MLKYKNKIGINWCLNCTKSNTTKTTCGCAETPGRWPIEEMREEFPEFGRCSGFKPFEKYIIYDQIR